MMVRLIKCFQLSALSGLGTLLIYLSWATRMSYLTNNIDAPSKTELDIANIPTIEPNLFPLRQANVRELCKDVNVTAVKLPKTIIYSKKTNIAYCPVMYVGSATIKYAILHTEGKSTRPHGKHKRSYAYGIHIEAQKLALRRNLHKLSGNANLLLVVRDPWQRLVTAYRMLTDPSNPSRDMRWCYNSLELQTNMDLTFNQFLDCVVKNNEMLALYLQPISELCAVCKIDYDRIVRLENLMPELKTFYTQVDARHKENTGRFLAAVSSAPTPQNYDIAPYLKSVSKANEDLIHKVYKNDFLMFGYSFLNEYDPHLSYKL